MSTIRLYCARHQTVHAVTHTDAELLIYALSKDLTIRPFCPATPVASEYAREMQALRRGHASMQGTPECPACGTWVCAEDGWRRVRASRTSTQTCWLCKGTKGAFLPTYHADRATREDHLETFRSGRTLDNFQHIV